tara:strand:+ start:620 stop:982 length:363 start_codon:yes stop_codon:yes gene_type:complete
MKYLEDVKDGVIARMLEKHPDTTQENIESYLTQPGGPAWDVLEVYYNELVKLLGSDYLILESKSHEDLRGQVLEAMMDGWEPFGPPSHSIAMTAAGRFASYENRGQSYIQGMIKAVSKEY